MNPTSQIIENIKKQSAQLIVDEILTTGISKVYNVGKCIEKVKNQLGIDLKENEQGYLVFAQ